MIAALTCIALLGGTYQFPVTPVQYSVNVKFDGFLPVFGGQDGTAEIILGVSVKGLPDKEGARRAESELTSAKVLFMGETLPFNVDNVRTYFPKTTIEFTPQGKITKTDAPDIVLPIRLPGLDVKRFPDVTYMPIEFPTAELKLNESWTFKKKLGATEAAYTAKVTELKDDIAIISVDMLQTTEDLENESLELVKDEKDAIARATTLLVGKGTLQFNWAKHMLKEMTVALESTSTVKTLKTGETKERKLKTNVLVKLKPDTP